MTDSVQRPPKGKPWIWLTRELLESHAWRSLSVNARRVIDFLLIENMSHAGRQNGRLLAPRRQLEQAGIAARLVSKAIKEAERLGLIDVERGKGRRPSLYTLNWLQLPDAGPSLSRDGVLRAP